MKGKIRTRVSVSDIKHLGWIIEGYPDPLSEKDCEQIVAAKDRVEQLEEIVRLCKPIIDESFESCGDEDAIAKFVIVYDKISLCFRTKKEKASERSNSN